MVLSAQRTLFGRTRVPAGGYGILCGHHIPTDRAVAGVNSPKAPGHFSPHGNVELILESNPAGTHYHGRAERIVTSPSKRHEKIVPFQRNLRPAPVPPYNPRRSEDKRFPKDAIKESEQRIVACKAGRGLPSSKSAPVLLSRRSALPPVLPPPGSPEGRPKPRNLAEELMAADDTDSHAAASPNGGGHIGAAASSDDEQAPPPITRPPAARHKLKPRSKSAGCLGRRGMSRHEEALGAAERHVSFALEAPPTLGARSAAEFAGVQREANATLEQMLEERTRCRDAVLSLRHAEGGLGRLLADRGAQAAATGVGGRAPLAPLGHTPNAPQPQSRLTSRERTPSKHLSKPHEASAIAMAKPSHTSLTTPSTSTESKGRTRVGVSSSSSSRASSEPYSREASTPSVNSTPSAPSALSAALDATPAFRAAFAHSAVIITPSITTASSAIPSSAIPFSATPSSASTCDSSSTCLARRVVPFAHSCNDSPEGQLPPSRSAPLLRAPWLSSSEYGSADSAVSAPATRYQQRLALADDGEPVEAMWHARARARCGRRAAASDVYASSPLQDSLPLHDSSPLRDSLPLQDSLPSDARCVDGSPACAESTPAVVRRADRRLHADGETTSPTAESPYTAAPILATPAASSVAPLATPTASSAALPRSASAGRPRVRGDEQMEVAVKPRRAISAGRGGLAALARTIAADKTPPARPAASASVPPLTPTPPATDESLMMSNGRPVTPGRLRASRSEEALAVATPSVVTSDASSLLDIRRGGGGRTASRYVALLAEQEERQLERQQQQQEERQQQRQLQRQLAPPPEASGWRASEHTRRRRGASAQGGASGRGSVSRGARGVTPSANAHGSRRSSSSWTPPAAPSLWQQAAAAIGASDGGRLRLWQAMQDKGRARKAGEGARWVREAPEESATVCNALFDEVRVQLARQPPPRIDHDLVTKLFAATSHLMVTQEGGRELLLPLLHVACEHASLSLDQIRNLHTEYCYAADPSGARRRWGALSLAARGSLSLARSARELASASDAAPASLAAVAKVAAGSKADAKALPRGRSIHQAAERIAQPPPAESPAASRPVVAPDRTTPSVDLGTVAASIGFATKMLKGQRPTVINPGLVVAARRGEVAFHTPATEVLRVKHDSSKDQAAKRMRPWSAAQLMPSKAIDFDDSAYGVD